jgi:thioredoxin-like negative regulator of GroEL
MRRGILLVISVIFGAVAGAKGLPRRGSKAGRAESEILYEKGMQRYAAGRFPEALQAFREALGRDPDSRAARVAVDRVRSEMAMMGASQTAAAGPGTAGDPTLLERVARYVEFADTVGDERELLGRAQALMGRISQLMAEKRLARARHRPFAKDRELHALSRRLA